MQMIMDALTPEALDQRKLLDGVVSTFGEERAPKLDHDKIAADALTDRLRKDADKRAEARDRAAFAKRKVIA